eukprot:4888564-Pyramimonas_sp.AAC.1
MARGGGSYSLVEDSNLRLAVTYRYDEISGIPYGEDGAEGSTQLVQNTRHRVLRLRSNETPTTSNKTWVPLTNTGDFPEDVSKPNCVGKPEARWLGA